VTENKTLATENYKRSQTKARELSNKIAKLRKQRTTSDEEVAELAKELADTIAKSEAAGAEAAADHATLLAATEAAEAASEAAGAASEAACEVRQMRCALPRSGG
jgi:uncharacterized coiled-coil DUF342 family protein